MKRAVKHSERHPITAILTRAALAAVLAAGALGATACGKKEEAKPTTGSGSAAMAGSGSGDMAGSGSAAAAAEVDVPTEVDFETDAKAKIDEKNVEAQLKAVEQELAQ